MEIPVLIEDVYNLIRKLAPDFDDAADFERCIPGGFGPKVDPILYAAHGWPYAGEVPEKVGYLDLADVVKELFCEEVFDSQKDWETRLGRFFSEPEKLFLYGSLGWHFPKKWKCCPPVAEISTYDCDQTRQDCQQVVLTFHVPNRPKVVNTQPQFTIVYDGAVF